MKWLKGIGLLLIANILIMVTLSGNSTACFTVPGLVFALLAPGIAQAQTCNRTITAKVVAIDQPIMYNRLGAQNINGMVFALRRDVIDKTTGLPEAAGGTLTPGKVQLRPDKRPRLLVLRVAEGDCLTIEFQNLLATPANPSQQPFGLPAFNAPFANEQVADRFASFHAQGLQLVSTGGMANDGSLVGENLVSSSGIVGSANSEIAELLGCSLRTVERRLHLIRDLWRAEESQSCVQPSPRSP